MKKFWISLLFLSLFSASVTAQPDTIKVLFVGNSFTYYNDLPGKFAQLANAANRPVYVQTHAPGGVSVGDTAQGTQAHMNNPVLYQMIRSNTWDYLVLQDNQGRFVYDYGVFPATSKVIEGHLKIRDSLLYHHPCAHMIWFAGWGPKAGYPPFSSTGTGLISRIYNNYRYLLDTAGQVIAPIGPAWQRIIAQHPGIELWDADDVHPGPNGSYLTAAVVYGTIFKSSAMQSPWIMPGLSSSDDSILKSTAWQSVYDSLNTTGLNMITPSLSQIGNTVSVQGFSSCNWYLNGTLVSPGSTSLILTQNGVYQALAFDAGGCSFLSLEQFISLNTAQEEMPLGSYHYNIFPNPVQTELTIETDEDFDELSLWNAMGQILCRIRNPRTTELLDMRSISPGMYFMRLHRKDGTYIVEPLIHK